MTRDFTDDIYEKGYEDRIFVPETSDLFCNLLVVVPNAKMNDFRENYSTLVQQFYDLNDPIDEAKLPENIEKKLRLMKDMKNEDWLTLQS